MNLIKITLQDGSILIRKGEAFYLESNTLCVQDERSRVETFTNVVKHTDRTNTYSRVIEVKNKRIVTKLFNSVEVFVQLADKRAASKNKPTADVWATVPSSYTIRAILKEGLLKHPDWSFRYVKASDPKICKPTYTEIYEVCPECGGYPTEREGQEIDGGVFEKLPDCDSCANGTKRVPASEVLEGEDYVLETGRDREVATCLKTMEVTYKGNTYHVAKFDGVIVTELETKK
jgi:hypothetical protein